MKFNSVTIPESLRGVVIKTKYLGATDYRGARIKATHKRENDRTFTKTISKDYELEPAQNALAAANALIESWEFKEYHPNMKIVSMGWDHDHYYFVVV
mgnify:FL=1|tara:strand:+ start:333 stop:626 length:294 start_codon:yes stop_codon:yes gene_type:complete